MIKMGEIVNKLLLIGYKFMPELHLKQPWSTYNTCGLLINIVRGLKNSNKQVIYICTKNLKLKQRHMVIKSGIIFVA